GELLPHLDRLRNFEGGDLVTTEGAQFFLAGGLSGKDTDDGMDAFAPMRIGQADHGDLVHRRVFGENVFDLGGEDVVAAGFDSEFGAVAEVDVATVVETRHVAGIDPAIADGFAILVGRVPVASEGDLTADDELADVAGRDVAAVVIDDTDV